MWDTMETEQALEMLAAQLAYLAAQYDAMLAVQS